MTTAALPYPIGINVLVFRDDGQWDNYRQWFLRTQKQIEELLVARITLGHYTDTDEPAYSHSDWVRKASEPRGNLGNRLLAKRRNGLTHPGWTS